MKNPFQGVQFQVRRVSFFRDDILIKKSTLGLGKGVRFVEGDNFPAGSPEALGCKR